MTEKGSYPISVEINCDYLVPNWSNGQRPMTFDPFPKVQVIKKLYYSWMITSFVDFCSIFLLLNADQMFLFISNLLWMRNSIHQFVSPYISTTKLVMSNDYWMNISSSLCQWKSKSAYYLSLHWFHIFK